MSSSRPTGTKMEKTFPRQSEFKIETPSSQRTQSKMDSSSFRQTGLKSSRIASKKSGLRVDSPVFTNFMEKMREMPTKIKEAPPKKFGKMGAALVAGGIGFGWVVFPYILSFAVAQIVHLAPGGEVHDIWKTIPQALDFSFYIFNVTNPKDVQNGAKPILQEVGPYRYVEWKKKVDLVDSPTDDEITYSSLNTWYFQPEKTKPLTGDELVTVPHLPLMSMLLVAEQDFPPAMLAVVNAAIPRIYGKLKDVFLTLKAKDLLFEGFPIDCTSKDLIGRTVCVAVKANSKPLVKNGKNKYLFSVLGAKNATAEDVRITVKKGTQNTYDIGKVVKLNGKPYNTVWNGECNTLEGSDATIFPPFRSADNVSIIAYAADICRSIRGTYVGEGEYNGVRGHKYVVDFGDMTNNPKDQCFCTKKCYKRGTVDMTKCQGAPLIASLPHFYLADESYLDGVVGLNPIREKHELSFIMEPITGVPLQARKRVQFNVDIHPIQFVNLTKNLRTTLFPIVWLEESLDLGPELMNFLNAKLLTNLKLVDFAKWSLIVGGCLVGAAGVAKHQMEKSQRQKHERGSRVSPSPSSESQVRLVSSQSSLTSSSNGGFLKSSEMLLDPSRLSGISKAVPLSVPHPHIPASPQIHALEKSLYEKLSPEPGGVPPVEVLPPQSGQLSTVKADISTSLGASEGGLKPPSVTGSPATSATLGSIRNPQQFDK